MVRHQVQDVQFSEIILIADRPIPVVANLERRVHGGVGHDLFSQLRLHLCEIEVRAGDVQPHAPARFRQARVVIQLEMRVMMIATREPLQVRVDAHVMKVHALLISRGDVLDVHVPGGGSIHGLHRLMILRMIVAHGDMAYG